MKHVKYVFLMFAVLMMCAGIQAAVTITTGPAADFDALDAMIRTATTDQIGFGDDANSSLAQTVTVGDEPIAVESVNLVFENDSRNTNDATLTMHIFEVADPMAGSISVPGTTLLTETFVVPNVGDGANDTLLTITLDSPLVLDADTSYAIWMDTSDASATNPGWEWVRSTGSGVYDGGGFYENGNVKGTETGERDGSLVLMGEVAIAGRAHSPIPSEDSTVFSYDVVGIADPNWLSPLQGKDGYPVTDSNIVSVDKYEVWWSVDEEPNFVTDTPYDNGTSQTYDLSAAGEAAIDYDTIYYWRVDTTVTWDSNEFTGTSGLTSVVEGALWSFTTEPAYTPPVIEVYENVISTLDIGGGDLSATITGNSDAITSVTWTLLAEDIEFPAGSDAVVVDTTTDTQNPTAQLTTTYEGIYKVKLVVSDGSGKEGSIQEAIAEVTIYADACEAQKAAGGWTANPYDFDENCLVDLLDFAAIAADWLDDTSMDAQETYTSTVQYVPQAVYDARIDAVADIIDPNVTCSDAPITDTEGIQIETDRANATDSTNLGSADTDSWVEYEVTLDAGTYDVYAGYSCNSGTGQELSFGIDGEPAKYGTVFLPATGSWDTFWGLHVGEVTFTESGTQTVRTTYGGYSNLDWFAFDPQ